MPIRLDSTTTVGNLAAPVAEWSVGGTALTSRMDVERRPGKFKPVIKKAMVELYGAPFKKFAAMREVWALKNRYLNPASSKVNHTFPLKLGAGALILLVGAQKIFGNDDGNSIPNAAGQSSNSVKTIDACL